jgi:hypothetical protein
MAANPSIAIPDLKLDAETRATESNEQKIMTLKQRFQHLLREMFKGHGENYFDGF